MLTLAFHASPRFVSRAATRSYYSQAMRAKYIDMSTPLNRGMLELDRDAFRKEITVLAARVPSMKAGLILRAPETKKSVLDLAKVKTVVPDPSSSDSRFVLLGATTEGDSHAWRLLEWILNMIKPAELSSEAKDFLKAQDAEIIPHKLVFDYDYWVADEILHAVLPEEIVDGAPAGFAATGHIAHMNLNDEYLPYKHLIGQVILDKNKKLRTVVNKLDSIDAKFRFFQMELLAGDADYVVEHHESDCSFTFDFTKVYWNSRLHTEHARLVDQFKSEDVVADVFAGVGPFALPAAKKGCAVWANDLNPDSYKYLQVNVDNNRVTDRVKATCEDGAEFIRTIAQRAFDSPFPAWTGPKSSKSQQRSQRKLRDSGAAPELQQDVVSTLPPRKLIGHFVMNLPDSALTFLDAFRGILSGPCLREAYQDKLPMVHCHCFTRELEPEKAQADILARAAEKLGHSVEEFSLHLVRSVAPNKDMYCVSFRLPEAVAFS